MQDLNVCKKQVFLVQYIFHFMVKIFLLDKMVDLYWW